MRSGSKPCCGELRERALGGHAQRGRHPERVAFVVRRVPDADPLAPTPAPRPRRARARAGVSSFESRTPRRCASPGTTAPTVTGPGPRAPADLVDPDHDLLARGPAPSFEPEGGSGHRRQRISGPPGPRPCTKRPRPPEVRTRAAVRRRRPEHGRQLTWRSRPSQYGLAQLELLQLAGRRARELVAELDARRALVVREQLTAVVDELALGGGRRPARAPRAPSPSRPTSRRGRRSPRPRRPPGA